MFLHYFSMNLLRILVASWSIFIVVQETISSEEVLLLKAAYRTPLAVVRNRHSSLRLAIPHYQSKENYRYAAYSYDNSDDGNGPKEKLMIACPASDAKQLQAQENWKNTDKMLSKSTLFFLSEYTNPNALCSEKWLPSVNKFKGDNSNDHVEHCNKLNAEMYEVGYPVSNDDAGKDVQFLSMYKICYSKAKRKAATLYSIHHIESPSMLFMDKIEELPNHQPLSSDNHYESVLDSSLSTKEAFKGMTYYKHQFVGEHDMASIRPWQMTTYFLFNYTPITRNEDLYKGMIRADWYIRLFSKQKNKTLTLYSGTHQQRIGNGFLYWVKKKMHPRRPADLFWRIISDDSGHGIILVMQHNQRKCASIYLCRKTLQVKTYKKGGCIYTCSVKENDNLFKLLGSPPLKIVGDLDFTIQSAKPYQTTGIIDFLDNISFLDALRNIDNKENILEHATYYED